MAGLGFAVNLEGRDFIGRDALQVASEQCDTARVGLEIDGRRVPREHYPIVVGEETIGEVSSGTFSPTLERPIAMGYVPKQYAAIGTELGVSIRGRVGAARVVPLPFYKR
jgi:aminomethyltransferase